MGGIGRNDAILKQLNAKATHRPDRLLVFLVDESLNVVGEFDRPLGYATDLLVLDAMNARKAGGGSGLLIVENYTSAEHRPNIGAERFRLLQARLLETELHLLDVITIAAGVTVSASGIQKYSRVALGSPW